jgi:hypothetical protein
MKVDLKRSEIFRDVKECFAGEAEAGVRAKIEMLLADQFQDLGRKIEDMKTGLLRGRLVRINGVCSRTCGETCTWSGIMR